MAEIALIGFLLAPRRTWVGYDRSTRAVRYLNAPALAADRRRWGRRLLNHLGALPITATSQREFIAAMTEEFVAAADEIDHGPGGVELPTLRPEPHPQSGLALSRRVSTPPLDGLGDHDANDH